MNTGIVKILDVNGLSYLYGKLKANIDSFQAASKAAIDAAISSTTTAADAANAAATAANNAVATLGSSNAASATKLATARTIEVAGAVKGSATFDGSANITITTAVSAGTSAPTSLANGEIYCVYE